MSALSSVLASRHFPWLILLALLGCYPLAILMEPNSAWENGLIENSQVLVLASGAVFALFAWLRMRPSAGAMLALCVLPAWIILGGRELSWGAVFLPALEVGAEGPIYSSRMVSYRPLVVPVLGVLVAIAGYFAWRHRLGRLLRGIIASGRFPWGLLAVMAVAGLASTVVEGHLLVPRSLFTHGLILEELVELVGYVALVAAQERVFHASAALDAPAAGARPAGAR